MNLNLPKEPRRGEPVEANTIARIIAALRALTPRGGPGIRVSTLPTGTTYAVDSRRRPAAGGGAGRIIDHLFLVTQTGEDEVTVAAGATQIAGEKLSDPVQSVVFDGLEQHSYIYMLWNYEANWWDASGGLVKITSDLPVEVPANRDVRFIAYVLVNSGKVTAIKQMHVGVMRAYRSMKANVCVDGEWQEVWLPHVPVAEEAE